MRSTLAHFSAACKCIFVQFMKKHLMYLFNSVNPWREMRVAHSWVKQQLQPADHHELGKVPCGILPRLIEDLTWIVVNFKPLNNKLVLSWASENISSGITEKGSSKLKELIIRCNYKLTWRIQHEIFENRSRDTTKITWYPVKEIDILNRILSWSIRLWNDQLTVDVESR